MRCGVPDDGPQKSSKQQHWRLRCGVVPYLRVAEVASGSPAASADALGTVWLVCGILKADIDRSGYAVAECKRWKSLQGRWWKCGSVGGNEPVKIALVLSAGWGGNGLTGCPLSLAADGPQAAYSNFSRHYFIIYCMFFTFQNCQSNTH